MHSSKNPASILAAALVLSLTAVSAFANQYDSQSSQSSRNDRSNQSQSTQGYQSSPSSQNYGSQSYQGGQGQALSADEVIQDWKDTPQKAAHEMIKKYGNPDEITKDRLVWHDNGPWEYTEITNEETDHKFPLPHKDALLQVVAYQVPADKFDDLAAFDGSVIVDRTRGLIGARCDKEAANFLALNLANEIATGKHSVEEARKIYGEQIVSLAKGKPTSYTKDLNFHSQMTAGDADKTTLDKSTVDQVTKLMKEQDEKMARGEDSNGTITR